MQLEWLHCEALARCPLCEAGGPKAAVLAVDHVVPGSPRVTLLRCPGCGAAFLQDLTPPDYEQGEGTVLLDYYVEQGAGIDIMVAPLLRLRPEAIHRCLEVGCSFGFALDFARHAFGWEVRGVDPSPLAAAGGEALGVPISRAYFTADLDLGSEPFDLALCSEILEHLDQPQALLAAIRERLAPSGLLILTTPNLAAIRPGAEEGALHRALSPGLHLMLYDPGSLTRLLAGAGFPAVRVEESSATLVAFAGRSAEALDPIGPAMPAHPRVLRDYYAARADAAPPGSALACGFAYRHFKECVNAGHYAEAAASRGRLRTVYQERCGLDLDDPSGLAACSAPPFNLTGALFFSGILELNHFGRRDRAAACFTAAVAAGCTMLAAQQPHGLYDGETEALLAQSRKHLPLALAGPHPEPAAGDVASPAAAAKPAIARRPAQLVARLAQALKRRVHAGAAGRLMIAERFVSPHARLAGLTLPLDVVARQPAARLRFVVLAEEGSLDVRLATLRRPDLAADDLLHLAFAPFDSPPGAAFLLGVLALPEGPPQSLDGELPALRAAAAGRPPIVLDTCGERDEPQRASGLLADERGIAVRRVFPRPPVAPSGLRTAYGIDAFWSDLYGIYVRGWVHAYEHRVHRLRIDVAGRRAIVQSLSERSDLPPLDPEDAVRPAGFAVYLPCPAGHPIQMTLETSGGAARFVLALPERPRPAWPANADAEDEVSPLLRRFADLANQRGGRVLHIGSRGLPAPSDGGADWARRLLHGPVIGLDIHPGPHVDVVGDVHVLSRFLRAGSVDAVVSASVLEHLQAPWLVAAEVNRVLRPGGLAYHEAPGAWPAHAQPNDFWRMSAEGLRALFGPESGFEVLDARDGCPAALYPTPEWRLRHLEMPTLPAFAMAEILVRKVREIPPGAVAWPLAAGAGEQRARQYPLSGVARGGLC